MHVPLRDLPPTIQKALRDVGYGRKDIEVEVGSTFSAPIAYGTGHRARVMVVNIATGERQEATGSWGGVNPFRQAPVDVPFAKSKLPPGFVALTSGHTKFWTLHVNPENAARLLPSAEKAELDLRELWLLWSFRGLTSAGRKNEWQRGTYDNPLGGPPTKAELTSLEAKGLIKTNSAGASQITTEGRNVIGKTGDYELIQKARKQDTVTADDILRGAGIKG